jgi:hypothetical protein
MALAAAYRNVRIIGSWSIGSGAYTLPSSRLAEWSNLGVWYNALDISRPWEGVRGIPAFTVGITMQNTNPAGAYYINPDGITDCRAAIQAAVTACPAHYAVFIPAGSYLSTGSITMKTGVVIRGAGPGVTIIYFTHYNATSGGCLSFSSGSGGVVAFADPTVGPDASYTSGPLVSGYEKGSYTVVLQHAEVAANLSPGDVVIINQLNNPDYVDYHGYGGDATWAAGGGTRANGETNMVRSVSGTSVTLVSPISEDFQASLAPKILRAGPAGGPVINSGVEDLTFNGGGVGGTAMFFYTSAHCWAKRVEVTNYMLKGALIMLGAYGHEITRDYIHDPTLFTGSSGYMMSLTYNTGRHYIYDNIAKLVHVGIALGSSGSSTNVVAYNYVHSTQHHTPSWAMCGIGTHGAHTQFTLMEGNVVPRILTDGYWGTGSHHTIFRNWSTGETNNPVAIKNQIAVEIEMSNYYHSAVGNILGTAGMNKGGYEISLLESHDNELDQIFMWKRGYNGSGSVTGYRDPKTLSTFIRHGNYDYYTESVADWVDGAGHDIPNSLYLSEKPAWFGSLDWPPFGPDGIPKTIPAKARWDAYAISGVLADLFADAT